MTVLVTGASGFVGGAVVRRLLAGGMAVRAAVRRDGTDVARGAARVVVGDLAGAARWDEALWGADAVVHAAARVHVMRDVAADPLAEFRRVNVEGTLHLARAAASAGVRRLVFLSSIKVNGEATTPGRPFTSDMPPAPVDAYGVSKCEAEAGLRAIAAATGLEVVIVRPVLVYGPGVKGNFLTMMRWLRAGVPLPFGAVRNRRSLVALDNLVDLVARCLEHPRAANRTFLASDGQDLATPELLRRTARAMRRPARLVPVPVGVLTRLATLAGRGETMMRLTGSLQVDIQDTCASLGWQPPVDIDSVLARTTRHFLDHQA